MASASSFAAVLREGAEHLAPKITIKLAEGVMVATRMTTKVAAKAAVGVNPAKGAAGKSFFEGTEYTILMRC